MKFSLFVIVKIWQTICQVNVDIISLDIISLNSTTVCSKKSGLKLKNKIAKNTIKKQIDSLRSCISIER